jgi:hypothetical protein
MSIVLPRQARDKHRENSKKETVFSQAAVEVRGVSERADSAERAVRSRGVWLSRAVLYGGEQLLHDLGAHLWVQPVPLFDRPILTMTGRDDGHWIYMTLYARARE